METGPSQDYILMPLWNDGSLFNSSSKDSDGDNKDNDGPCKESEIDNQERPNVENSTKDVNTAGQSINTAGQKVDISNISTTYHIPTTPNTRIHKDYSLDNVIGDMQSGVQTRRMTVTTDEQRTQKDYQCIKRSSMGRSNARRTPAVSSTKGFLVYQMDIKSAFLYRRIEEEVYVFQPLGFEDPDYPDKVYNVEKALYGLHQAPRAWYETLAKYLLDNGFHKVKIDQTLFIKRQKEDIMLVQVYVDDIIFGSNKKELCTEFEKLMHDKLQMSSIGELTFFLGLQVKQKSDGIFISQDKYVNEILRKFKYADVKPASNPMDKEKALLKDSDGDDCKKKTVVATSTIKAEYVAAASCCGQLNATVDGQDKTITEASVRRHLKLVDADGISTLPTTKIFKQLALMGYGTNSDKVTFQKGLTQKVFSKMKREYKGFSRVETALFPTMLVNEQLSQGEGKLGPEQEEWALEYLSPMYHQRGSPVQARPERLSNLPNEPPLGEGNTSQSEESSMQLLELMDICAKLPGKVTTLENELKSIKDVYNKAFITLTKRVKKLEKKLKHTRRRAVVDSSKDQEASLDKEDSPKQERMIEEIDEDENVNLVKSSKQREAHETAGHRKESDNTEVVDFSTASPQKDDDEITLDETLVNIKKSAAKDKGKSIMKKSEPPKKIKKR
nr:putative ribonuclease H-like domain-containing protein [Tanacetum cinerariifolium]